MDIAPKKKVKIRVLVLVYVKTYGVVNNVMFLAPVILVKIVMISVKTVEYPLVKTINVLVAVLKAGMEIDVINNVPNKTYKHFVKISVKMEEYLIVIKVNVPVIVKVNGVETSVKKFVQIVIVQPMYVIKKNVMNK
jgi:hypothetical protein